MSQNITANSDIRRLMDNQEKLVTAVHTLFELLEHYAPQWYTQKHHDIAADALASTKKRRSPSSVRHGLKHAV